MCHNDLLCDVEAEPGALFLTLRGRPTHELLEDLFGEPAGDSWPGIGYRQQDVRALVDDSDGYRPGIGIFYGIVHEILNDLAEFYLVRHGERLGRIRREIQLQ